MIIIAKDQVREPLYAIVPYFNPWRYKSRVKLAERAIKHFVDSGAVVILVEAAFNRRELVFADSGLDGTPASNCGVLGSDHAFRHVYVPLRTTGEVWLKENLINIGAQRIPDPKWEQICWLDADVHFVRPNWVGECIHKLQHYKFLQMFSDARDLDPEYQMLPADYTHASGPSFVSAWQNGDLPPIVQADIAAIKKDIAVVWRDVAKLEADLKQNGYPPSVWPGLAWACTRDAFDEVGGLFDVAIWGGGDYDMAHCLIEEAWARIHHEVHPNYSRLVLEWEDRCRIHIRRNVGVMNGTIFHYWHGRKTDRKYVEKRKLMQNSKLDPLRHLKRDSQGLWQMHDDGSEQYIHFRDMMRKIAKERNEDSIDV